MGNEKQNDVEELLVDNEPATESVNVPETLDINSEPVVEENIEVLIENEGEDNKVEVLEEEKASEVSNNDEVILEPVPSQAQMTGVTENVQEISAPPVQEVVTEVATPVEEANVAAVSTEEVQNVENVSEAVQPRVENTNSTEVSTVAVNVDVPATNMDAPNVNSDVPNVNSEVVAEVANSNPAPVVNNVDPGTKKSKAGLIIGIIIALLVAIAILVGVVVIKSMSTPYNIFNALVDRGYEEISTNLKELDQKYIKYNMEDTIVTNGNIKINSNLSDYSQYFAYDYDYKVGLDPKNKQVEVAAAIKKDNQVAIDVFMHLIGEKLYIKSDKAYNKVLYSNLGENVFDEINFDELKTNYTVDDINKLIELYFGYIKKAVKEDKFVTEKATIKYENKELEVKKHLYEMNNNEQFEFANSIYEDIKNDNEFKSLVKKITNLTDEEYNEILTEMKPEKEDYEEVKPISFYIYTKGLFPSVVGFGMADADNSINFIGEEDEKIEYAYVSKNLNVSGFINGDVIEGTATAGSDNVTYKATMRETENSIGANIEVKLTIEDTPVNVKFDFETKKVNEKKMTNKFSGEVKLNMADMGDITVGADITNDIEIGAKLGELDVTNAVDMETLPESEQAVILNNIMEAATGTPLELIFNLATNEEDTALEA